MPCRALESAGAACQEQPSLGRDTCHRQQRQPGATRSIFEDDLLGLHEQAEVRGSHGGRKLQGSHESRVKISPVCLFSRWFSLSLWGSFQLQPRLKSKLMLGYLSMTSDVTSRRTYSTCPGETEAQGVELTH